MHRLVHRSARMTRSSKPVCQERSSRNDRGQRRGGNRRSTLRLSPAPCRLQRRRTKTTGAIGRAMPRFAANLTFLFNEVPFLERFGEAANAGFHAVEFAFPYEWPTREIAERASANKLEVVLINAPPGNWETGERGTASLPGREHDFQASFATALRYAQAFKCQRVHVMAGVLPFDADTELIARRRTTLLRNL